MAFRNLSKRMLFVLWALPLGWWVVNADFSVLPKQFTQGLLHMPDLVVYPGQVAMVLLVLIAAHEYSRMLAIRFKTNGFWLIYLWLSFQMVSYFFPQLSLSIRFDKDIYVLLLLVAAEAIVWGKSSRRWKRASLLFSGTVFLSTAAFSAFGMYQQPFQDVFARKFEPSMLSQLGIVTVCGSVWLCDSAAYFFGTWLGRHHFSSISPSKTIEGSLAGLVTAVVVSTAGWYFFADKQYPIFLGVMMGVIIGLFAQAGDLMVSLMKRYFHVKDASDIIPGHGGVLDRFDSIFFTMPILSVFFVLISKFF